MLARRRRQRAERLCWAWLRVSHEPCTRGVLPAWRRHRRHGARLSLLGESARAVAAGESARAVQTLTPYLAMYVGAVRASTAPTRWV
jgi:hypothetical protein